MEDPKGTHVVFGVFFICAFNYRLIYQLSIVVCYYVGLLVFVKDPIFVGILPAKCL